MNLIYFFSCLLDSSICQPKGSHLLWMPDIKHRWFIVSFCDTFREARNHFDIWLQTSFKPLTYNAVVIVIMSNAEQALNVIPYRPTKRWCIDVRQITHTEMQSNSTTCDWKMVLPTSSSKTWRHTGNTNSVQLETFMPQACQCHHSIVFFTYLYMKHFARWILTNAVINRFGMQLFHLVLFDHDHHHIHYSSYPPRVWQ